MKYPIALAIGVLLLAVIRAHAADSAAAPIPLTLETIMADPDWIGPAASDAYWSADGRAVYYSLKRTASPLKDLHRIDVASGKDAIVSPAEHAEADMPAVFDRSGARAAFVRGSDVFVRTLPGGKLTQITRSSAKKELPQFSADGKLLSFRSGNDWFVHDFTSGLTAPAAVVKAEKDPDAQEPDDLRDVQLRVFSTLKKLHDDKEQGRREADALRRADATQSAAPFYLGDDVLLRATFLSPDARWLLVVTTQKSVAKGREGQLTHYVTESGYEEVEKERERVGRNPPAPQSLLLLDLMAHSVHPLKFDRLPGINDDPLRAVREENAKTHPWVKAQPDGAPKPRGMVIIGEEVEDAHSGTVVWSPDSQGLAVELFSIDNKDRWIVSVDLKNYELVVQNRVSDTAWVNSDSLGAAGWVDGHTLWYQSEESGYGQLYVKPLDGAARALTHGRFEVSNPVLSDDGRWFYAISNAEAPYAYDVYRVAVNGGEMQRLTHFQGVEKFALQQKGTQLLVTHSSAYVPSQLAVASVGSAKVRELTDTRTAEFKSIAWIQPEIVQVPSTHFDGVIYGKLYRAQTHGAHHPGVLFVHGAGYLQDVTLHYSYYFREQMFNNLLAQHGYSVLDLDYRASQGYGRDWRTAIYRQMGHPELEDLLDGKQWLVQHAGVDGARVGMYGGSYGGFMTLMALFRAPGEFAAGAALRPVTDWMQYDDGYTSAILNDPKVDPLAYERSSPIEFAAGLKDFLLICHGVIDDNVLFEDSMRLYERLIELHKDDFSLSPYPLDRHGFSNADSWLDEYKRIYKLFEARLQ